MWTGKTHFSCTSDFRKNCEALHHSGRISMWTDRALVFYGQIKWTKEHTCTCCLQNLSFLTPLIVCIWVNPRCISFFTYAVYTVHYMLIVFVSYIHCRHRVLDLPGHPLLWALQYHDDPRWGRLLQLPQDLPRHHPVLGLLPHMDVATTLRLEPLWSRGSRHHLLCRLDCQDSK